MLYDGAARAISGFVSSCLVASLVVLMGGARPRTTSSEDRYLTLSRSVHRAVPRRSSEARRRVVNISTRSMLHEPVLLRMGVNAPSVYAPDPPVSQSPARCIFVQCRGRHTTSFDYVRSSLNPPTTASYTSASAVPGSPHRGLRLWDLHTCRLSVRWYWRAAHPCRLASACDAGITCESWCIPGGVPCV